MGLPLRTLSLRRKRQTNLERNRAIETRSAARLNRNAMPADQDRRVGPGTQGVHSMISVSICSPSLNIAAAWADLTKRASPNVFMNPAALTAASEIKFAQVYVLL